MATALCQDETIETVEVKIGSTSTPIRFEQDENLVIAIFSLPANVGASDVLEFGFTSRFEDNTSRFWGIDIRPDEFEEKDWKNETGSGLSPTDLEPAGCDYDFG